MKDIIMFIKESSSNEAWFTFNFKGIKDSDIVKSISNVAYKQGVYSETVLDGIKLKLTSENAAKANKISELINDFINSHQNDEDVNKDTINSLMKTVSKFDSYIDKHTEEGE